VAEDVVYGGGKGGGAEVFYGLGGGHAGVAAVAVGEGEQAGDVAPCGQVVGDGDVFADFAYPFPMRGWFVAFDFGAGVYGQGAGSAFGNGGGAFEREAFVFVTEPHFAGKRDMFGQALAQGFDDMVDKIRLFE